MKTVNANKFDENPTLTETVEPENDLKNILVEYVGEKLNPEDQNVTVEMIIETMASDFPEFLLAVAEENWVRGYQQGLDDVELGRKVTEKSEKKDAKQRSCKLCEE